MENIKKNKKEIIMDYKQFVEKREKEISKFPMAFAFNKQQLVKAMEKLKVSSPKELINIPAGGIIRKKDIPEYKALVKKLNDENRKMMANDSFLYDAMVYEMLNHEYPISLDITSVLDALGLSLKEFQTDRVQKIFNKAKIKAYEKIIW